MWPWRRTAISKTQAQAEAAIATSLTGGDSLPAWNAIWDLVQSRDAQGKQEILHELRSYVADSVNGAHVDQHRSFEQALDQSMRPTHVRYQDGQPPGIADSTRAIRHTRPVPQSKEVRQQAAHDQIETHRSAMRDIGVRPGDGIPMWALYMTRRNKRSWG